MCAAGQGSGIRAEFEATRPQDRPRLEIVERRIGFPQGQRRVERRAHRDLRDAGEGGEKLRPTGQENGHDISGANTGSPQGQDLAVGDRSNVGR